MKERPAVNRSELLDRLLLKYEHGLILDDEIARDWTEEAERRDRAMEDGEEPGVPAEEVFRRLRSSRT